MALNKKVIKAIIFDLDDTLFDTYGQLVSPANREACQAMIKAGLKAELEDCVNKKNEFAKNKLRKDVFKMLAEHFGCDEHVKEDKVIRAGFDAFHNRDVNEDITPFEDCHSTLAALKKKYRLFLVTIGNPSTQIRKVEKLGLAPFFERILYVDVKHTKQKTAAFLQVQSLTRLTAPEHLVIGNRIDLEIANGKSLNMQAILMDHGEYVHLRPQNPLEESDATVTELHKLLELL